MHSASFFISPEELWTRIGTAVAPQIFDTRKRAVYDESAGLLPTAVWRDTADIAQWSKALDRARPIVFACRLAHNMSQTPAAHLRGEGYDARVLAGGYGAWADAKLPLVNKPALDRFAKTRPSLWVTRRRPKIDRIACPWLIRRFIDAEARVLFVDPDQVGEVAKQTGAIPFDIEGVEISHEGPRCSFDTMLKIFGLESEPSLARLALIVRGADTARPELAPEAAGLHAVSLGLSALAGDDDHGLLRNGFMVYDALFAWLRVASSERHNWPAAGGKA
jgi:rhodanese-related sulfurtransferase